MLYNTLQDYREDWDLAYKIDPPVPLNVDIELASICNLRCPSCFIPDPKFEKFISQKSADGGSLRRLMPKDMAFQIIDQCANIGVPALKFNWRGESTLHPDYSEIVKYAAWKSEGNNEIIYPVFHELLANTNANCGEHAIDGLMACTKVMVSLDSMDEQTYRKMRVGGSLNKAFETINELINRKHPNLWIRRVLTKQNIHENFCQAVYEKWGEAVKCSSHYCFDRNEKVNEEVSGCDHDEDMPRKYCGYPSQRMLITSRGFVYPCCLDLHETMSMGNINENSILEIWTSEKYKTLRSDLKSNDVSRMTDTCKNCSSWMAYDKTQRNYVQDVKEIVNHANG